MVKFTAIWDASVFLFSKKSFLWWERLMAFLILSTNDLISCESFNFECFDRAVGGASNLLEPPNNCWPMLLSLHLCYSGLERINLPHCISSWQSCMQRIKKSDTEGAELSTTHITVQLLTYTIMIVNLTSQACLFELNMHLVVIPLHIRKLPRTWLCTSLKWFLLSAFCFTEMYAVSLVLF